MEILPYEDTKYRMLVSWKYCYMKTVNIECLCHGNIAMLYEDTKYRMLVSWKYCYMKTLNIEHVCVMEILPNEDTKY